MTESHPILRQRAELVRVKSGQFPKQQLIIGGNGNFIGQWVELSAENVVNNLQISVVEQVDVDSWKNHLNTALESGFPVKHKSLNDLNFFGVVASVEPAWSLKLLRHKQDRSKVDLIIMYNHGYGDGTSSLFGQCCNRSSLQRFAKRTLLKQISTNQITFLFSIKITTICFSFCFW